MSQKLGKYGIEDIPKLNKEDLYKNFLPIQVELCDASKKTDYRSSSNRAVKIVSGLFFSGGQIYFSQKAKDEIGLDTVNNAHKYFKSLLESFQPEHNDKIAVCSWIADNIFDLDKMTN